MMRTIEFRCQFPADPVWHHKIPLPAGLRNLVQKADIAGFSYAEQGVLGSETDFFPAVREVTKHGDAPTGLWSADMASGVAHISRI